MARRAKKQPTQEQYNDFEPGSGAQGGQEQEQSTPKATVEDVLAKLEGLQARLDKAERTNMALMSAAPRVEERDMRPASTEVDFSDLPDPVTYPKEYAAELTKRTQAAFQAQVAAQERQRGVSATREQQAKQLWDRFSTAHKEYASHQDRVEFAAAQVAQDAKARGIDLERYMFGPGADMFLEDVKKRMDDIFGAPGAGQKGKGKAQDDEEEEEDEQDDARSTSIFGGLESAGRPGRPSKEDVGDMIKELQDTQRKSGWY